MPPASHPAAPPAPVRDDTAPEGYRYHLLRAAQARFQRNIAALAPHERGEAETQARRSCALEQRVLQSAEAREVLIPDTQIQRAYREIQQRYADAAEFAADLARNGLDPRALRQALRRELTFDAVMQRVGARHEPVTEADERLFHELHRARFEHPERRSARHILITINEEYPENQRGAARARIEASSERLAALAGDPPALRQRFIDEARSCSECPTAMEGGQLGTVARGQLYPALDAALFALAEGALSGVLESELGFHLLLCEQVHPAQHLGFEQVRARIHSALEKRRRDQAQRLWLSQLADPADADAAAR